MCNLVIGYITKEFFAIPISLVYHYNLPLAQLCMYMYVHRDFYCTYMVGLTNIKLLHEEVRHAVWQGGMYISCSVHLCM